jgi:hypothetical protein
MFAKNIVINCSFGGCAAPSVECMLRMLLIKGRCEFGFTPHLAPLRKAGALWDADYYRWSRWCLQCL